MVDTEPISPLPTTTLSRRSLPRRAGCDGFFAAPWPALAVGLAARLAVRRRRSSTGIRLPAGGPLAGRHAGAAAAVAEQAARRLVTTVSALHAAFLQVGPWEGSFTERQFNAWLAVDLPRNHAAILPTAVETPRVRVAARPRAGRGAGWPGLLAAIAWIDAEPDRCGSPTNSGITLADARLGSLPLPRGPILRQIARRLEPPRCWSRKSAAATAASAGGVHSLDPPGRRHEPLARVAADRQPANWPSPARPAAGRSVATAP